MTLERIAVICFCILITSAIAAGQQRSTRSQSGGREVVVETLEGLNIDGRLAPLEEVVTETTQGPATTQTRQDVFRVTADGQRRLAETSESRQDTRANGDTSAVHDTWVPDLNGRLRLTSRVVEETRSFASDVQRTDATLLVPSINDGLREAERIESTTRRVNPEVVRHESTRLVRDVNGRWKAVEIRRGDARETGTSQRVEEETVQRVDLNGNVAVTEVNVIRSSRTKGEEQEVFETYAPHTNVPSVNGRPPLGERVRRTTTVAADGVRHTVEEVEARSRVSANEPLRVIRRTVTTVSPTGRDEWVTERRVFEPDLDGRLRLVRVE
jgi:hypothetical protein